MRITQIPLAPILLAAGMLAPVAALAADPVHVKVGVITDMAGSLSSQSGKGSEIAAQMAREDCLAGPCKGMTIDVISADHRNDAALATSIVREWIDVQHVDAVTDIIQAAVQIAVQHLMEEKGKIALFPGGTARLTNEDCAPSTSVQWMWDTYGQARGLIEPLPKPGKKFFFLAADYAFGHGLVDDGTDIMKANGGTTVGTVFHPFNFAGDFSTFLLQGQSSGADYLVVGSTGGDLVNVLKQAHEFGIPRAPQQLIAFNLTLPDVAALGQDVAQGVTTLENFYWNMDAEARTWSERFFARHHAMPSAIQAGVYSVTLAYLKAAAAAGTNDTKAVMAKLHTLPIQDPVMRHASLRPDGRMEHDGYLWKVKAPSQSKMAYDFYEPIATVPADKAFRPLDRSLCPKEKWWHG